MHFSVKRLQNSDLKPEMNFNYIIIIIIHVYFGTPMRIIKHLFIYVFTKASPTR